MVEVADISIDEVVRWLEPRPDNSHKGMFGNVLVIGGDFGMPGSVRLVAEGALRVGAGVVTVVTRPEHVSAVVSGRPEIMCYGLDESFSILDTLIKRATVVVIGPGLGQGDWSVKLFNKIIKLSLPMLIDADALNLLAKMGDSSVDLSNCILTPHPGEAARLLGISTSNIQEFREKSVLQIQDKYSATVVLKGSKSLVCSSQNLINKCIDGNAGMSSAGMGDLLSGVIIGLLAQGLSADRAAQAGVVLHAVAADIAIKNTSVRGLLASDLLTEIVHLID
ncbi:MAG: NAD(P)H-hydrate dehydratase [Legionellaceae bacterium]|nr:NAD(P)H-hydrate dehydratase [Legionellaceae bacterium]